MQNDEPDRESDLRSRARRTSRESERGAAEHGRVPLLDARERARTVATRTRRRSHGRVRENARRTRSRTRTILPGFLFFVLATIVGIVYSL